MQIPKMPADHRVENSPRSVVDKEIWGNGKGYENGDPQKPNEKKILRSTKSFPEHWTETLRTGFLSKLFIFAILFIVPGFDLIRIPRSGPTTGRSARDSWLFQGHMVCYKREYCCGRLTTDYHLSALSLSSKFTFVGATILVARFPLFYRPWKSLLFVVSF